MSSWMSSASLLARRMYYSFRHGTGRIVLPLVALVLLAGAAIHGWTKWGHRLVERPEFMLTPESVEVTPQPDWIHADVKAEVIRDATLTGANILDPDVTVKVARAFELHAWVATVNRVSKSYPGRIRVELQYRRPVAMVEVYAGQKRWLLPVDEQAVLLPGEDFSRKQARDYLRIATGNVAATGPVGTRWEDSRVAGAAQIAGALVDCWQPLGLYRIALVQNHDVLAGHGDAEFDLLTREGQRVVWGHAPGNENPGEASTRQKVAALIEWVRQHGSLASQSPGAELDLRDGIARPMPRTARLP